MSLPAALRAAVEARLGAVRAAALVQESGTAAAFRVETVRGSVFLRYRPSAPAGYFAAEAEGLGALTAAAGCVVPRVIAVAPAWIALEWLDPVAPDRGYEERLGRGLAALHTAPVAGWGWRGPTFIGGLAQDNAPASSWLEFWRERRLEPQLRSATDAGRLPGRAADWRRLLQRLDELLAPARGAAPALLHGDLWSGNVLSTARGPALIDPAVYHGHSEADLAMMELFGGFGSRVHDAYREAAPNPDGARCRPVYQLYYLLVHVNLFGGAYLARTAHLLQRCLGG